MAKAMALGPVPNGDSRSGMIGRGTDRGKQVGTSGHVERLAVRSNSERERRMRHWNRSARRVGGYPDRCHRVAARVEDVECPSVGCDGHVKRLVPHRDWGERAVGGDADV
jgi:hypothetical protein